MWIVPRNYPPSSHSALGMVESKEDLILLESSIESSLMWRSKPSRLQTWSTRWSRVYWLPRLFGRTLKPSHHTSFEAMLTSSLEATHASPSAQQATGLAERTTGTCGRSSTITSPSSILDAYFSRTSRDTSRLDSPQSLAIWKNEVTTRRGEYSQRVKSAHLTREKECSSWATPNTMDYLPQRSEEALHRQATTTRKGRTRPANLREQVNPKAVEVYQSWPTPDVAQAQKVSNRPNYGQLGLANHPAVHGVDVSRPRQKKDRAGLSGQDQTSTTGKNPEQFGVLNPAWVEQLMGLPSGWTELTELDYSETE